MSNTNSGSKNASVRVTPNTLLFSGIDEGNSTLSIRSLLSSDCHSIQIFEPILSLNIFFNSSTSSIGSLSIEVIMEFGDRPIDLANEFSLTVNMVIPALSVERFEIGVSEETKRNRNTNEIKHNIMLLEGSTARSALFFFSGNLEISSLLNSRDGLVGRILKV